MWYFLIYYIVGGIIWGIATQLIIENKGYKDSYWFWCGFFFEFVAVLVALSKPKNENSSYVEAKSAEIRKQDAIQSGAWTCKKCGRFNYAYMTTCTCGMAKSENDSYQPILGAVVSESKQSDSLDQIKKLKELLDIGAITQDEFNEQKAKLLDAHN